jgi:NADH-quinone oxidoreductase subunit J
MESVLSIFPLAAGVSPVLSPIAVLVLCVVAGVGTVMLLPSGREMPLRKIGGVLLAAALLILVALITRTLHEQHFEGMGVYFWIFSAIALVGAIRVVTHDRPVYSALYFVLTVFASAGLFILMYAEFMAAALVLIYAGAILVTYVFVIMLASEAAPRGQGTTPLGGLAECDRESREPALAAAVGFLMMGVLLFIVFDKAKGLEPAPVEAIPASAIVPAKAAMPADAVNTLGSTQSVGAYLFQNQLINLELAGLILTVGMIGAIVIAKRTVVLHTGAAAGVTDVVLGPATPINDDPHSIPVYGTLNPAQKEYPEH